MQAQHTRNGNFPIGFRALGGGWRQDISQIIDFAKGNGFGAVDLGGLEPEKLKQAGDAGLRLGTVDLPPGWDEIASKDAGKRNAKVDEYADYVEKAVAVGAKVFFMVIFAEDAAAPRGESFAQAVEGWAALCQKIESTGAKLVIEGWPGPPPYYHSLVCTPEAYRMFLKEVGSDVMGVNFDPSHLVRMGIDSVRFLDEFIDRSYHVHAKDTELFSEAVYEYGNLQPHIAGKPHSYGGLQWRYTIPGHGQIPWSRLFDKLADSSFDGVVSIELEDERFFGSEENEKLGLVASRDFLKYA